MHYDGAAVLNIIVHLPPSSPSPEHGSQPGGTPRVLGEGDGVHVPHVELGRVGSQSELRVQMSSQSQLTWTEPVLTLLQV